MTESKNELETEKSLGSRGSLGRTAWVMLLIIGLVVVGYVALILIGDEALEKAPGSRAIRKIFTEGIGGGAEGPGVIGRPDPLTGGGVNPTAAPSPLTARVTPSPALSPRVLPPAPDDPSLLTFTFEFENTTGVRLTGVRLTNRLPSGTTFKDGSATSGGVFDGSQVVWNLGTLDPGATGKVSLQVLTRRKGSITNEGLLTSNEAPASTVRSTATVN